MHSRVSTAPNPRRLTLALWLLIVLVSLYPYAGWRDHGAPVLDFLAAPWPRVVPWLDVAGNLLAYLPLGFCLCLVLASHLVPGAAALAAVLCTAATSLGIEVAQNFLPSRVASNLDLACNTLGALAGVLLARRWGGLFGREGRLGRGWHGAVAPGLSTDTAIALLGLWCVAQWSPRLPLFSTGSWLPWIDWSVWLPPPHFLAFTPERYVLIETVAVASGAIGAGLVLPLVLRRLRRSAGIVTLGAGALAKALGAGLLTANASVPLLEASRAWFGPGALHGALAGLAALLMLSALWRHWQRGLAMLAIGVSLVAANILPSNPYHLPSVPAYPATQWLNLDGLSQLAGAVWPLLALLWLTRLRKEE